MRYFNAFVLDENAKSLAHSLRINQRLEEQPGAGLLAFAHRGGLQIGEIAAPSEAQQKIGLRRKARALQPGEPAVAFQTREIQGQPSVDALKLEGTEAPSPGYEIVPTQEGKALVGYLLSLKKNYPLPEAPEATE